MKKVFSLMLIGCLSVGSLFANEQVSNNENKQNKEEMKKERLDEAKKRTIERISERISMLEKAKQCISNANSKDDLEKCRPNHEEHKQHTNNGESR